MTNWIDLATDSHYRTAAAIRDALQAGELAEVATGLDELIEVLHRAELRALEHHLVRLILLSYRVGRPCGASKARRRSPA